MPAATTKPELIDACEREFAKLSALIAGVEAENAGCPGSDGLSIRDIVSHRARWIDLYLGWSAAGRAGRPVHVPAEGYGWGDLKALNAKFRAEDASLSWEDAVVRLADRHARLMTFLRAQTQAELYDVPMTGGNGKWTEGRYAEAAGASHYRSAAKVIRGHLREAAQG